MAELGIAPARKERRPGNSASVTNVREADKWRSQIIREISRKIGKIQDTGLSEFQVRDLNDEINKLFREKRHWEYRIKELGGPDYRRTAPRMLDEEGKEVPGSHGYRYFGRAKDLPGVRELLEVPAADDSETKTRGEMYKNVDADYYGYRDEEDGMLLEYEAKLEAEELEKAQAADMAAGLLSKGSSTAVDGDVDFIMTSVTGNSNSNSDGGDGSGAAWAREYKYVQSVVPTLEEVEK
ncbi:NineTeen Complex (NTC) component, partial [Blyttiomyces sp. JEL0837]